MPGSLGAAGPPVLHAQADPGRRGGRCTVARPQPRVAALPAHPAAVPAGPRGPRHTRDVCSPPMLCTASPGCVPGRSVGTAASRWCPGGAERWAPGFPVAPMQGWAGGLDVAFGRGCSCPGAVLFSYFQKTKPRSPQGFI